MIGFAHRPVPRLVLDAIDPAGVRGCGQVRRGKTAGDQLLEKPVSVSAVGNARKRPVLPRQAHPRMLEHEYQKARLPRRETADRYARQTAGVIIHPGTPPPRRQQPPRGLVRVIDSASDPPASRRCLG
jgi:hypothetical protein